MNRFLFCMLLAVPAYLFSAAQQFEKPTRVFLMHSSGNHLKMDTSVGGVLESSTVAIPQKVTFIPDGKGYYNIKVDGAEPRFLAQHNTWNTTFIADSSSDKAKFSIESASKYLVRIRCKSNNKCIGTDSNDAGQKVFSDKSGDDIKHQWYFSDNVKATLPSDTMTYVVNPLVVRQHFDGWGVSLCWWANMCGKWSDKKIDEIITWLVSPTGLNYSHFRYNIGGGDDPNNKNCTAHHMGNGKGLRAEMEGFKDSSDDEYHWDRDAAQRKILLRIKEKRPDAVFEAFSNSCPYYMTYSGCVSGNKDGGKDNLRPDYYKEFAHYLVDVCKHYKDEYDIEFKTLEPFNESVTNFWYANGVQEGCHFDYSSQVAFIKVLSPILKASGLKTVISASDETNVGLSVEGFKQYKNGGVLPLVGQWNTHTYSGNNLDRVHVSQLAREINMPLWMSEVGSGGNGIGGNLALTQRLFDDMRYIQPEAWIDWQYMEEANDQWCTIRGSFSQQTYYKVKNFFVRQQCSRFIKRGYDIITSLCNQSLAAMNPARDTLVVVLLNEGSPTTHNIDLSLFDELPAQSKMRAYRTSANEDLAVVRNYVLKGKMLTVNLPAQSITTLVIPVKVDYVAETQPLRTDCEYLIVPRNENMRALSATGSSVTIQDIDYGEAQRWMLTEQDGAYIIQNALGLKLTGHRTANSSSLTAYKQNAREQTFSIESIDFPYYKILLSQSKKYALDLEHEGTGAGTVVDTWEYTANTTTPTHRQWMFFPLTGSQSNTDAISEIVMTDGRQGVVSDMNGIYDMSGRRIANTSSLPFLSPGIYIIRYNGEVQKVMK